jgi:hypothetical protein
MKTLLLFPHAWRWPGVILAALGLALGVAGLFGGFEPTWLDARVPALYLDEFMGDQGWFQWVENNLLDEIGLVLSIVGLMAVAFSREKSEDEYALQLRLDALLWAVYANYAILLVGTLFIYGGGFFYILVFNCLTILVIFIGRYRFMMHKAARHAE